MTAEQVVRAHTDVFNRALLSHDLETLSQLYADDYMLVRPDGSVLSKQEVLRDLRDGGLTFKAIEMSDVKVRIYGDAALVTANSQTVTSRAGQESRVRLQLLAVYVADAGRLRLAHFQSVSVPISRSAP